MIETLALALTGNERSVAAPYYTEGAIYNDAGVPTVICGPGLDFNGENSSCGLVTWH